MSFPRNEADLASVSCLDDRVRGRLYAFVSGCGEPVGRDEAAAAVGIGRALAAYHLDQLVRSGLLTASYRRPPGRGGPGAGRPAKVYARSGDEFMVTFPPREYELAARLLVQAVAADRSGRALAALHEAARQLGAELGAGRGERPRDEQAQGGAPPLAAAQRPEWLALESALSEHGFEPWRDDAGALRMRNCPFARLAQLQPEVVCRMNLALIQGLVAALGAVGLNPVHDPEPGQCCVAIVAARHDRNGTP
ncbi:MAG TPA: transcriptional regulator [Streptosporangiaceae bacterium]|nr:transcriptional regulator [Streptosporangiaceae bacterium]